MRVLFITLFIVITDQLSKLLVKGITVPWLGIDIQGMRYGVSRPILGNFFRLTYIENPGMAFGIDIGGKLFFSLFSILLSVGIFFYLYRARNENGWFRVALALVLGGAIGNLIDRTFYGLIFNEAQLFYGKVVDFFDVDFFDIHIGPMKLLFWSFHGLDIQRWPVFNVADAAVTVGIILLLFVHHHHEQSEVAQEPGHHQTLADGRITDSPSLEDRPS